jgi:curved DNA-binding protein CbpA
MPDPYAVLQVARNAEAEVIAAAYRALARKYHPDNSAAGAGTKRMQDINAAYEILKDPARRKLYDREHPFPTDRVIWRTADAIDWQNPPDPEDHAEWASSYPNRRKRPVVIRRPGFFERNLGCIFFLLLALFAGYQVFSAVAGKW